MLIDVLKKHFFKSPFQQIVSHRWKKKVWALLGWFDHVWSCLGCLCELVSLKKNNNNNDVISFTKDSVKEALSLWLDWTRVFWLKHSAKNSNTELSSSHYFVLCTFFLMCFCHRTHQITCILACRWILLLFFFFLFSFILWGTLKTIPDDENNDNERADE